jgi:arginine repressor
VLSYFMNRELLERSLAQAERHVIQGERHVAHQQDLVAKLERDGHDTSQAIQLLRQFQELQALHIADHDRLRKLLRLSA